MPNIEAELVHVAVVVILKNNRVLIAKRAKNVHQGDLWEFPGGKLEKEESIEHACVREIQEELGIGILQSHPLIKILHHYQDKSVLLETRLCTEFEGREYQIDDKLSGKKQFGMEGQPVTWVKIDQLDHYDFPEANQSIIDALKLPDKYVISPDYQEVDHSLFLQQLARNCEHFSLIQLRLKSIKGVLLQRILQASYALARKNKVKLLVNSSNINLSANDLDVDGIHLTSSHLADTNFIKNWRQRYPDSIISASCHHAADIEQANFNKLNFIVLSPVQKTLSHSGQDSLGWKNFSDLCFLAKMPCYALGGMDESDINIARQNGAQGISGITGLWRFIG